MGVRTEGCACVCKVVWVEDCEHGLVVVRSYMGLRRRKECASWGAEVSEQRFWGVRVSGSGSWGCEGEWALRLERIWRVVSRESGGEGM